MNYTQLKRELSAPSMNLSLSLSFLRDLYQIQDVSTCLPDEGDINEQTSFCQTLVSALKTKETSHRLLLIEFLKKIACQAPKTLEKDAEKMINACFYKIAEYENPQFFALCWETAIEISTRTNQKSSIISLMIDTVLLNETPLFTVTQTHKKQVLTGALALATKGSLDYEKTQEIIKYCFKKGYDKEKNTLLHAIFNDEACHDFILSALPLMLKNEPEKTVAYIEQWDPQSPLLWPFITKYHDQENPSPSMERALETTIRGYFNGLRQKGDYRTYLIFLEEWNVQPALKQELIVTSLVDIKEKPLAESLKLIQHYKVSYHDFYIEHILTDPHFINKRALSIIKEAPDSVIEYWSIEKDFERAYQKIKPSIWKKIKP